MTDQIIELLARRERDIADTELWYFGAPMVEHITASMFAFVHYTIAATKPPRCHE